MKLVHYSPHANLTELDPNKMGSSGVGGAQYKRGLPENKSTFYYTEDSAPESLVTQNSPHKYSADATGKSVYDLDTDPDKLVSEMKQRNQNAWNEDLLHSIIKEKGHHGVSWSQSPETRVVQMYSPMKVQPFGKSEELKKGVAKHLFGKLNPSKLPGRETVSTWQTGVDKVNSVNEEAGNGDYHSEQDHQRLRSAIPKMEDNARFRAMQKLSNQTVSRRHPETGERQFLMFRGVGPDEMKSSLGQHHIQHNKHSSWTPKKSIASGFRSDYSGADGEEGKTLAAWVNESDIHSAPHMYGQLPKYGADFTMSHPQGKNDWYTEHEIVLAPHKSQRATKADVKKYSDIHDPPVPNRLNPKPVHDINQRINLRADYGPTDRSPAAGLFARPKKLAASEAKKINPKDPILGNKPVEKPATDKWIERLKMHQEKSKLQKAKKTVYHGTPHVFDKFKIDRNARDLNYGRGVYFAEKPEEAAGYSTIQPYHPDFGAARAKYDKTKESKIHSKMSDVEARKNLRANAITNAAGGSPHVRRAEINIKNPFNPYNIEHAKKVSQVAGHPDDFADFVDHNKEDPHETNFYNMMVGHGLGWNPKKGYSDFYGPKMKHTERAEKLNRAIRAAGFDSIHVPDKGHYVVFNTKQIKDKAFGKTELNKGAQGDWKKEGYSLKHQAIPEVFRGKQTGFITHHVTALHPSGEEIGHYQFSQWPDEGGDSHYLDVNSSNTQPEHQRKGLATAAYQLVENNTGRKIAPQGMQTASAVKLWAQPNRPFGKTEPLMKPYQSDAQRKWAHTEAGTKALGGKEAVKEWDSATKGKRLPEKLNKNETPSLVKSLIELFASRLKY